MKNKKILKAAFIGIGLSILLLATKESNIGKVFICSGMAIFIYLLIIKGINKSTINGKKY